MSGLTYGPYEINIFFYARRRLKHVDGLAFLWYLGLYTSTAGVFKRAVNCIMLYISETNIHNVIFGKLMFITHDRDDQIVQGTVV